MECRKPIFLFPNFQSTFCTTKSVRYQIKLIAKRIFDTVIRNFPNEVSEVFVKTSTGYYGGFGATIKDIKSIKSVIPDMPVKASGGVSDLTSCLNMIEAGADRIGTSKALIIYNEWKKEN